MPPTDDLSLSQPESAEDFFARVMAATDSDGRLPVAVEEMPGWDIYPYELDSLRLKPIQPLATEEPPRGGEDPASCWCARAAADRDPKAEAAIVWENERWRLHLSHPTGLPLLVSLGPVEHHDLPSLPRELAAEMGQLMVVIADAIESLPSVGRAQVAKYGDGGAHLHLLFMGRPARALQFRGSPLIDWEENLPRVPLDVARANAAVVVERLLVHAGGRRGPGMSGDPL